MDIHTIEGVRAEDIALAHTLDQAVQEKYGVEYRRYWLNHECGRVYCLVQAPNAEAARAVHAEAHGLLPEKIIEVDPEVAEGLLGSVALIPSGLVVSPGTADQPESATRTILFTDIVDSRAMTQRLGDEAAMVLLRIHDSIVREAVSRGGGREVKHTGDGIMACFLSTASAVRSAVAVQRGLREHSASADATAVQVRIGLAAGEPVEEAGDLFGTSVQLAARLCSRADAGQILVSGVVAELCAGKGLPFDDVGEIALKGFDRPARAFSVPWSRIAG